MGEEMGTWFEPSPSSLEDTAVQENSLFREIGQTLSDTAKSTYRFGVETVRTKLADAFMNSGEGKKIAENYKYKTLGENLPLILAIIAAVFLGGYFLRKA